MLRLIRGLPGSGKTTLAKQYNCLHLEADMYFIKNEQYSFDKHQLQKAHQWCLSQTEIAFKNNMDVVVSNTFVQLWELERYIKLANLYNVNYKIIEATGNYHNSHNIPEAKLIQLKNKWQQFPHYSVKDDSS
ncbi:MAG: AAA family ATPase [Methylococcales bacterium]|jgi:adenylate kinase family enzyme|nr:AAA family ATPase [Methylococcales bacterium]